MKDVPTQKEYEKLLKDREIQYNTIRMIRNTINKLIDEISKEREYEILMNQKLEETKEKIRIYEIAKEKGIDC